MTQRITYYKSDNFVLDVEQKEGLLFLHMSVEKWSHHVLYELFEVIENLIKESRENGYKSIMATTDNRKTMKFWHLVRPCDEVFEFGKGKFIGIWYI